MTWFDWVVIGVTGVSTLFGLWNGFVRELLALVGWVAAIVCALLFGPDLAAVLPAAVPGPGLRLILGIVAVFLGVRIGAALISMFIARMARAAGLGVSDRVLGGVFGAARALVLLVVGVLIGGLTSLPRDPGWRDAQFARPLEQMALLAKPYLPDALAERLRFPAPDRASPLTPS